MYQVLFRVCSFTHYLILNIVKPHEVAIIIPILRKRKLNTHTRLPAGSGRIQVQTDSSDERNPVLAPLTVEPSCTDMHPFYFPVLGSPLEPVPLRTAVWEPVCGSQVISQRPQWVEDVLLASSFKTWNTFFRGKKILYRDVPFFKCMQKHFANHQEVYNMPIRNYYSTVHQHYNSNTLWIKLPFCEVVGEFNH